MLKYLYKGYFTLLTSLRLYDITKETCGEHVCCCPKGSCLTLTFMPDHRGYPYVKVIVPSSIIEFCHTSIDWSGHALTFLFAIERGEKNERIARMPNRHDDL